MAVAETITLDVIFNGKKAQMGLKELGKRLNGIQKTAKKTTNAFSKLMKFAGFAGFTKMAIDAAHFGRSMGLLADKTGIATEKLSSMRNAFSAIGGDAKAVDRLLGNITSGLARLSMGEGEFAAKLSAMGISAWDSMGNTKRADAVMGDLADWTKSQLAMGRSMAEVSTFLHDNFGIEQDLVNELALGRAGMEQARRERERRTGAVTGGEIASLRSLNESFATLKTTVGVLIDKVMAGLAPVIEFFTDLLTVAFKTLQDSFGYLFGSFSDIIGEGDEVAKLFQFLKGVLQVFGLITKGVIDVLKGFFEAVKMVGEWFGQFFAWLRSSWIGKKLFGDDTDDTVANSMEERIDKQEQEGKISHEAANNLRARLGIGKKDTFIPTGAYDIEFLNGDEVVQADDYGSAPIVNLSVNTEAKFNEATGQIEQNVDVNGQSEGSSGSAPINYMYQSVRG